MPNNTSNNVHIDGPQDILDEIKCSHFTDEESLDFNSIIPCPQSMGIESSTTVAQFARLFQKKGIDTATFLGTAETLNEVAVRALLYATPAFIPTIRSHTSFESLKDSLKMAEKHNHNITKHGYSDWYSWNNAYWGTKWNAYSGSIASTQGTLSFYFESAWSPAAPVLNELAALYPEVQIEHKYIDEGAGFAGITEYIDGVEKDDIHISDVQEFGMEEFGWEPYEDEEDI